MKLKIFIFVLLIIALLVGYLWGKNLTQNNPSSNETSEFSLISQISAPDNITKTQESSDKTLPITFPLSYKIENVPFATQAPNANWDHLHDEACEEASLTIVDYYLKKMPLSASEMEKQIQALTSWEQNNWGQGDKDLTIAEEQNLAEEFYELSPMVVSINSIDDIKKEISQNHIVIVPAAGQLLNNPNFRSPGPVYHMLVVTGYTSSEIITNDVGTRNGQNYHYPNSVFWNALHDWNGSAATITSGPKTILVF